MKDEYDFKKLEKARPKYLGKGVKIMAKKVVKKVKKVVKKKK